MADRIPTYLIILLPLMVTMGVSIHQSHAAALVVATVVILALRLESPFLILGGLYAAAWMGFVYSFGFLGGNPAIVFTVTDALIALIIGMVFFLAILHSRVSAKTIGNIICISALLQAGLAFLQMLDWDPVHRAVGAVVQARASGDFTWNTPVGTMGNQNWLGAYLSICLPFFFCRDRRWVQPGMAVALIVLATSTVPVLAALAGICFIAFGWLGLGIAGISGLCYVMAFDHGHLTAGDARLQYWASGLKASFRSWHSALVGWGPGIGWAADNHLHNGYLQVLFNYGLIGLGLIVGYIASALKSSKTLTACVVIIAVNMAGNNPLHVVPCAMLILTVMALIERERKHKEA